MNYLDILLFFGSLFSLGVLAWNANQRFGLEGLNRVNNNKISTALVIITLIFYAASAIVNYS